MLFGPIMLAYFAMLAILGLIHIVDHPGIILEPLNPVNALRFFYVDGFTAFIALGAVVLAVQGAEALYADMGPFGSGPIRLRWMTRSDERSVGQECGRLCRPRWAPSH